jgi:hypothetical protein
MTNPEYALTIREYFAIMALQGNLAACQHSYPDAKQVAEKSVEYADALIEELNKKNEQNR